VGWCTIRQDSAGAANSAVRGAQAGLWRVRTHTHTHKHAIKLDCFLELNSGFSCAAYVLKVPLQGPRAIIERPLWKSYEFYR